MKTGTAQFALVVAGGTGTRLGAGIPKQLVLIQGKPILVHTLERLLEYDPNMVICTVLHASLLEEWEALLKQYFPLSLHSRLLACPGGPERTSSVFNGLKTLREYRDQHQIEEAYVAIHDAVRPFIDRELLTTAFTQARQMGNAVAAVPVKSSLRKMESGASKAVDRSQYFHVQTPQIFELGQILQCYLQRPHEHFTDDASLAESQGIRIFLCQGSYRNIKITTPEDLAMARIMLT